MLLLTGKMQCHLGVCACSLKTSLMFRLLECGGARVFCMFPASHIVELYALTVF